MRKTACRVLLLLGILTALFGAGLDHLLPGTSPGVNLPQLLIIGAGLAVSLGAYRLGRAGSRPSPLAGPRRGLLSALLLTIGTLLILELILLAAGISTYVPSELLNRVALTIHSSRCDESGCRADHDVIAAACARGEMKGRSCIVNRQGFADSEDFVVGEDFGERLKILMLGDSFTHGYSADVGSSFVESSEARFPDVVVWNAGYTSTGTNQALASFETIGAVLQPDLTVLGFYMNDFKDNLTPVESWYETINGRGNRVYVRPYRLDYWGNAIRLDEASTQYFVAHGMYPPVNDIERLLGSLRLGTLLLKLRDSVATLEYADRLFAKGVEVTREYLRQLGESAAAQSTELLVLVIPAVPELPEPSEAYDTAISLMEELQLPYFGLADVVNLADHYVPHPDGHWNSAGHRKVGKILGDCIQVFIENGSLDDCDFLVQP